jgi:predicted amidohydrolase
METKDQNRTVKAVLCQLEPKKGQKESNLERARVSMEKYGK